MAHRENILVSASGEYLPFIRVAYQLTLLELTQCCDRRLGPHHWLSHDQSSLIGTVESQHPGITLPHCTTHLLSLMCWIPMRFDSWENIQGGSGVWLVKCWCDSRPGVWGNYAQGWTQAEGNEKVCDSKESDAVTDPYFITVNNFSHLRISLQKNENSDFAGRDIMKIHISLMFIISTPWHLYWMTQKSRIIHYFWNKDFMRSHLPIMENLQWQGDFLDVSGRVTRCNPVRCSLPVTVSLMHWLGKYHGTVLDLLVLHGKRGMN